VAEFFRFDRSIWNKGSGFDQTISAFNALPGHLGKKHLQAAMRKAVKPFAPALRSATPVATGNLRRAVKTVLRLYSNAGYWWTVVGVVGYSRRSDKKNGRGFHSNIVERGTRERFRKNRQSTGRSPARHMLRETLRDKSPAILGNLTREMARSLELAARELAREQSRGRYR